MQGKIAGLCQGLSAKIWGKNCPEGGGGLMFSMVLSFFGQYLHAYIKYDYDFTHHICT